MSKRYQLILRDLHGPAGEQVKIDVGAMFGIDDDPIEDAEYRIRKALLQLADRAEREASEQQEAAEAALGIPVPPSTG